MKLTPNRSITVESDATATTTEPSYAASWADKDGGGDSVGALTGTTAVTVVGGPNAYSRNVEDITVYNRDTVSHTITVKKVDPSAGYTIFKASLGAGESLVYEGTKWTAYSALGEAKTNPTSSATSAAGTKNGATVTATERGYGAVHQTTLTFAATPITMRDTEQGGGVKIYDFPEGRIALLGAVGSIAVTTTSVLADTLNAGVTGNWGVGTTTQASATLATTEQDIIQVANFTASATVNVAGAASNGAGAATAWDGTATAKDAYLNLAVAGATDIDANATVTVSGSVTLTWVNLGDV